MRPDFLAIGHVTRDRTKEGLVPGGTVTYAALTAARMGLRPAILTSASTDALPLSPVRDVPTHVVRSTETTTFRNVYEGGRRTQHLEAVAADIGPADVPEEWLGAPMVLLGPVVGELAPELARRFLGSTVVASLQGWLRTWDADGLVAPSPWRGDDLLPDASAAVVAESDIADAADAAHWARLAPLLIVTRGALGSTVHKGARTHEVHAFPANELDPTGAGDVFAAAFLIRYHETGDALEAAEFASCAAAISVEGPGVQGVPSRSEVEECLIARR